MARSLIFRRPLAPGERLFGLGDKAFPLDRRGNVYELWNSDEPRFSHGSDPLYRSIPLLFGVREDSAWCVYVESSARLVFDCRDDEVRVFGPGRPRVHRLVGRRFADVLARASELVGRMPLPPLWALGYHQSRWSYGDAKAVRAVVREFRRRRIPLDVLHLDGILTVAGLACLARERGLDFLAVTDHNTISHSAELPAAAAHAGLLLLPGFELTTDCGHANCLGIDRWLDFRRTADAWLDDTEAAGGLLSINHPVAGDMASRLPTERRPPLVEVWHSSWDRRWLGPIEWWEEGAPVSRSGTATFTASATTTSPAPRRPGSKSKTTTCSEHSAPAGSPSRPVRASRSLFGRRIRSSSSTPTARPWSTTREGGDGSPPTGKACPLGGAPTGSSATMARPALTP